MWFLYAFYAVHGTESLNPARRRVLQQHQENQLLCIQYEYVDPYTAFYFSTLTALNPVTLHLPDFFVFQRPGF